MGNTRPLTIAVAPTLAYIPTMPTAGAAVNTRAMPGMEK